MSDELQQPELSDDDLLRLLAGVLDDHEPIPEAALAAAYSATTCVW